MDMPVHRLAGHGEDPLVPPEMSRVQVALYAILKNGVDDEHGALGAAGELYVGRSPRPLFECAEHHHEIVAVIDEVTRSEGQNLRNPGAGSPHKVKDQAVSWVFFGVEKVQDFGLE